MNRQTVRTSARRTSLHEPSLLVVIFSWAAIFVYGVMPTAIPHVFLNLFYALTLDNPDLGDKWPIVLRVAPSVFLFYRMYILGRVSWYRVKIAVALVFAMVGDLAFMKRDGDSFLIAMGMYAIMHIIVIAALNTGGFSGVAFGSSACLLMMWNLILIPRLSESYTYLGPFYTTLVCATFWRASAQPDFEFYGTRSSALVAALFFLVAHFNLSLNAFGVVKPYDYLNIISIVVFSLGQLMLSISTFDEVKVFAVNNIRRL